MLSLAIATTLVGFALLVVGLITGQVWFAIACIVICLIGVGLLVVDVIRSGRVKDDAPTGADDWSHDDASEPAPLRDGPAVAPTPAPTLRREEPFESQYVAPPPQQSAGSVRFPSQNVPSQQVPSQQPQTTGEAAAQFADTSAGGTEGSFSDYVAATSDSTGPVPQIPNPQFPNSDGIRWESSIAPQQGELVDRQASNFDTDSWHQYPGAEHDAPTTGRTQSPGQQRRHGQDSEFDPLDPNWHPSGQ